ncbi:SIMPL domain-containing protein [Bartonella harrusi]|uniref:SIMPL domain-containing protein n=1 Tax=Bartonella harrusi TaxID=2961895 RepID=A0ABY5ES40_9HYPH|nr:SIMPL domain-containing protein [Bartonella harrusi]UTO27924.1 SIMPL domain-containing protein [Bartonella harrusi]
MTKTIFQSLNYYKVKIAMIMLALLACSFPIHAAESKTKDRTITVSATGETSVTPDVAIINLAIVTEDTTAQKALTANNKSMNDIINAFKKNGIQENDLQTSNLNIYPYNPHNEHKDNEKKTHEKLYRVSHSLTVYIRDFANAGKIFDQAMALDVKSVNNIYFTNNNTEPFYKEARKNAIAKAIEKAKTIAQEANLKLGKIITINEGSNNHYPREHLRSGSIEDDYDNTNLAGGELSYVVNITMVFDIE